MDPLSRLFAQTLDNIEYLREQGSISEAAYAACVSNLLQVDTAPPTPSAATSSAAPSRTTSLAPSEPYIVDSPVDARPAPQRGSVNQAVYDYVNEERISDVTDQLLKATGFFSKKDRKELRAALAKPLGKAVATATDANKQAALRRATGKSLASVGRSTSGALRRMRPARSSTESTSSAQGELAPGDEIVTDDDGTDPRFVRTVSTALDIAPGLRLDVTTVVRVVLDPDVLLAVDEPAADAPPVHPAARSYHS